MGRIFDIVEHPNVGSDELAYREPQSGSGDFRIGSQVIVRDNQAAVFVRDGQALDVFSGGSHTITTANVPLLVNLIGRAFSNQTPFKVEVYFINTGDFPQVGWGTSQPLALETPGKGLGWLLLQGHGVMDFHVGDPQRFARQYALGKAVVGISDIKERLLTMVLGELQDVIAKNVRGDLMGLNRLLDEVEATVLAKLQDKFDAVGLGLKSFEMTPLSAAKTTAEDLRNMGLLDVATYQALQAADALRDAAQNPGGAAGAGVGLGAGIGLGQAMAGALAGQHAPGSGGSEVVASAPTNAAGVQSLLDSLDLRLAKGEIDQTTYDRLSEKWQTRLKELK
jgi:membrane protease subunit (stomatin/prohibitin family)